MGKRGNGEEEKTFGYYFRVFCFAFSRFPFYPFRYFPFCCRCCSFSLSSAIGRGIMENGKERVCAGRRAERIAIRTVHA